MSGREKMLFVGPTGAGKTRAMVDIAVEALKVGKSVFFLAFDDGYARHLPRVERWLKHHTDDEWNPPESVGTFHLWDCVDWPSTRKAYNECKKLWGKGDWVMFDRADMAWDFIQEYTGALMEGVSVAQLDQVYYERRMERLAGATPGERERIKSNPSGEADLDWNSIKGNFKGVLFDALCGTDSRLMRMNVVVSELASMGITRWSKQETTSQKEDPRRLYEYNMTIQGEKNIPGWCEGTIIFLKTPVGYTISSGKDRERRGFSGEVVVGGFWETYQGLIGEELEV